MADNDINVLIDKRATVWAQVQELRDRIASPEAGGNADAAAEDRANFDRLVADVTGLTADIGRLTNLREAEKVDYSRVIDTSGEHNRSVAEREAAETRGAKPDEEQMARQYRATFLDYVRRGGRQLTREQETLLMETRMEETRAQGIGANTAGGYTVPPLFRDVLIEVLKYYSGMRTNATIIQTSQGGPLPWMTNNDTTNVGAILGENTQVTELDLTFGSASFDVWMYTSLMVQVSLQLLQDSALDLENFLPRKLGERIGRIQNTHFTVGTGTGQPLGLVTGATNVYQLPTGSTGAFSYANLIDASHSRLDPAYLNGMRLKWMGSQLAISSFLKIVDGQGRPLWQPSLVVGAPDTLLGYPIVLNNDVPVPAASAKCLVFGDIEASYVIRDVVGLNVLRLDERYADFLQVAFIAYMRSGGMVQNNSSYVVVQNSAT